jgi:DnaJ-class molecular chaperone
MSDGGKGSAPRPLSVDNNTFADNWASTFGKKELPITMEPDEDDEDDACSWCGGCGEGMYDGAACGKCKGTGVEPVEREDEP